MLPKINIVSNLRLQFPEKLRKSRLRQNDGFLVKMACIHLAFELFIFFISED